MTRRSYDHHCPIARALDAVGDRWALLVVRELMAGPRRYTDLHADLPGVSTDMLAARLRDLEKQGVVHRRTMAPPAPAKLYELTERGRRLLPVLTELAAWGGDDLDEPRPTDAVRAHWFAIPLLRALERVDFGGATGEIEVCLPEGVIHVSIADDGLTFADGHAREPDATLLVSAAARTAIARGEAGVAECIARGALEVTGRGQVADAVRRTAV